jgi:hypothetical protein
MNDKQLVHLRKKLMLSQWTRADKDLLLAYVEQSTSLLCKALEALEPFEQYCIDRCTAGPDNGIILTAYPDQKDPIRVRHFRVSASVAAKLRGALG